MKHTVIVDPVLPLIAQGSSAIKVATCISWTRASGDADFLDSAVTAEPRAQPVVQTDS